MKNFLLLIFSIVLLSGCSEVINEVNKGIEGFNKGIEEVGNSVGYITEATDYLTDLTLFVNETSVLLDGDLTNVDSVLQLEQSITELKSDIKEFNQLVPPSFAEDIHNQIVSNNELLLVEVDKMFVNGEIIVETVKGSPAFDVILEMTSLIREIEQLSTSIEGIGEGVGE